MRALLSAGIRVSGVGCGDAMGAKGLICGGREKEGVNTVNVHDNSRPLSWSGHDQEIIRLVTEVSYAVHQTGRVSSALTRVAAEVAELMAQVDALAGQVHALVAAHDAPRTRVSQPAPQSVSDDR
jgi:hypothetical protein